MRSTLYLSALLCKINLHYLRDRHEKLFQAPQGHVDAMIIFRITSLMAFVCLDLLTHAWKECTHQLQLALPWGSRHLFSPELPGKDVMILLLFSAAAESVRGSEEQPAARTLYTSFNIAICTERIVDRGSACMNLRANIHTTSK